MRVLIKILFIVFLYAYMPQAYAKDDYSNQTFIKVGVFDFKHQTDMLAIGKKKITENKIDLPYLGNLEQIFDIILMTDLKESLTFDNQDGLDEREEYAIYFSSGYQKNFNLSENINILPSFSVGLYNEFDQGKDMGFPIEFKSEIELNFRTKNNFVYGVTYSHISNANIGNKNPGSDSIMVGFRYKN